MSEDETIRAMRERMQWQRDSGPSLLEQIASCEHARSEPFRDGSVVAVVCSKCGVILNSWDIEDDK